MDSFLQELAQARPNPGGGAAAAYGGRVGLALLLKVAQLELNRRQRPEAPAPLAWEKVQAQLRRLAEALEGLQGRDVRAYFDLTAARASGDAALLSAAVREAVDCPGQITRQACESLDILAWVGSRCQKHLVSDLLVAVELLGAALRGALHIAGANLPLVTKEEDREAMKRELDQAGREGEDRYRRVKGVLVARERGLDSCG